MRRAGGSKRWLRNVKTINAILKGKNRITPSRRFVEGISETKERVVDGRSGTLVRWTEWVRQKRFEMNDSSFPGSMLIRCQSMCKGHKKL